MTVFEKIYFTCLVLNIVFFILRQIDVFEEWSYIIDLEWLGYLLGFQIELTAGYLVVKLILWIWGINIDFSLVSN